MQHNKKYIVYVVIVMILSVVYISAFEYYDKDSNSIQSLYEKISSKNLKEVYVNLSAVQYEDPLNVTEMTKRENELIGAMSHDETCSKLCGVSCHYDNTDSTVQINDDEAVLMINNVEDSVPYRLMITTTENDADSTQYNFEYMGIKDLELLDIRIERAKEFLESNDVQVREYIYFIGEIKGSINDKAKEGIVSEIFGNLGSNIEGKYMGEATNEGESDESAYYGYTSVFEDYIIGMDGQKNNVEVNFSYNEKLDITTYRVAFPFFNSPY